MTALAVRGSRFQNGVSRIHGGVSSQHAAPSSGRRCRPRRTRSATSPTACTCRPSSRPSGPTLFDRFLGIGWTQRLRPARLLDAHRRRCPTTSSGACASTSSRACCTWCATACASSTSATRAARRTSTACSSSPIPANPNVLTIGFARRFATYKRADAAVRQPRLAARRSRSDPERPVLFLFAGKAHPADEPGQDVIRRIAQLSRMPEFEGTHPARRGLRPAPRAPARVRRRRVAQQSGLPAGGLGHLGHEGRHERRHQPLGARRLVGRGLRRRQRLGDQAGVASSSTRRGATTRKRARSTRSCRTR